MTVKEVFELLEENKNQRGIDNWNRMIKTDLKSYGIGLTVLRKLAKKVGRSAELAAELWDTDCYDAKIISLLIDDPKTMTREQAERQVEQLEGGYLEHVFSSCDATLGKTDFVEDVIADWKDSADNTRRSCAYGLLYELSKSKKKSSPGDEYFLNHLREIEANYPSAGPQLLLSMGLAVQGIGHRNKELHSPALELARKIGPIDFSTDGRKCDPYDLVKNLSSDYLLEKFGLKV